MVNFAWLLSFYLRFSGIFLIAKGTPSLSLYLKLIPFILLSWSLSFLILKPVKSNVYRIITFDEILWIIRVCFLSTLIFICISYFYNEYKYSRIVLLIFIVIHPIFSIITTVLLNYFLNQYQKKYPPRRILIVGSGNNLISYIRETLESKTTPAVIIGVVLIGKKQTRESTRKNLLKNKLGVLEPPKDWTHFLSNINCEEVILSLPHDSVTYLHRYLNHLIDQVSDIKIIPDLLELTKFQCGIEYTGKNPTISIHKNPLKDHGLLIKRMFDVLGALIAGIIFLIPSLIIALIIKLTSKGDIIFFQERVGLDGRPFKMLKFRTMTVSRTEESNQIWTKKKDARCTLIGSLLRKTSLDEIPQIINVLMGQMSLIGPRPERPHFVKKFRQHIPRYMLRHQVKAGMTGWAQINGLRGDTNIKKRIEFDLHYIQNWSLTFDLKIILKTIYKGFYNTNAY